MNGYIPKANKEFGHPAPKKPVFGPTPFTAPEYGKKIQYAKEDTSPKVSEKMKTLIQKIAGKYLYPARAIDHTMLQPLNDLCIAANSPSEQTMQDLNHFLDYCASNPDPKIIYRASDMLLQLYTDAAYLVAPKARSRAAGYHFLGNKDGNLHNGPIYVLAKIIKAVMSSAAEAESGGAFMNATEACAFRTTLEELGWKQPATPIITDNSTARGIMNKTIKQKRSKAMDMRFYWLRDRIEQGQFSMLWEPGKFNLADYPSKRHPASNHKLVRPIHLYIKGKSPSTLQGCVEILKRAR